MRSHEMIALLDGRASQDERCKELQDVISNLGNEHAEFYWQHGYVNIKGIDMKHINDLIKQYGTQQKLADAMGVSQSQIARWVRIGAFVNVYLGEVYILTRKVNPV